jgi:hypothetical protein
MEDVLAQKKTTTLYICINKQFFEFNNVDKNAIEGLIQASSLISDEGIKLGNYNYDIDIYKDPDNWDWTVSLTRWNSECKGCPLYENGCNGDVPPPNAEKYPCANMEPVYPYDEYYEFSNRVEISSCKELTVMDKYALLLIWMRKDKEINLPSSLDF